MLLCFSGQVQLSFLRNQVSTPFPPLLEDHIFFLLVSSFLQLYSPISHLYKEESAKIPWVDVSLQLGAQVNNGFLRFSYSSVTNLVCLALISDLHCNRLRAAATASVASAAEASAGLTDAVRAPVMVKPEHVT